MEHSKIHLIRIALTIYAPHPTHPSLLSSPPLPCVQRLDITMMDFCSVCVTIKSKPFSLHNDNTRQLQPGSLLHIAKDKHLNQ